MAMLPGDRPLGDAAPRSYLRGLTGHMAQRYDHMHLRFSRMSWKLDLGGLPAPQPIQFMKLH
jgi:hypothetical protein